MNKTPKGSRLHIAIIGKRNVGKSAIINALTHQDVSIVSSHPGTTTDPVYKAMELHNLGPVVFIDTAGIDDIGAIGSERIKRTEKALEAADMTLVLITPDDEDLSLEKEWISKLKDKKTKIIIAVNKIDIAKSQDYKNKLFYFSKETNIPVFLINAKTGEGIDNLRDSLSKHAPSSWEAPCIVGDLIEPGSIAVLVVPIDIEAPKGRLILPQVQTLRDILDNNSVGIITKESTLSDTLKSLNKKPAIVITDSQVFETVNKIVPKNIPLTSFSILMARYKGDIEELLKGVEAIKKLKPGDKVLIAEACTHHPVEDDIGREKIPRWLESYINGNLDFSWISGKDFPDNLSEYKMVIHCGGCMINRKEMISRIQKCKEAGVPITNYGLIIAATKGILDRVSQVFINSR